MQTVSLCANSTRLIPCAHACGDQIIATIEKLWWLTDGSRLLGASTFTRSIAAGRRCAPQLANLRMKRVGATLTWSFAERRLMSCSNFFSATGRNRLAPTSARPKRVRRSRTRGHIRWPSLAAVPTACPAACICCWPLRSRIRAKVSGLLRLILHRTRIRSTHSKLRPSAVLTYDCCCRELLIRTRHCARVNRTIRIYWRPGCAFLSGMMHCCMRRRR